MSSSAQPESHSLPFACEGYNAICLQPSRCNAESATLPIYLPISRRHIVRPPRGAGGRSGHGGQPWTTKLRC